MTVRFFGKGIENQNQGEITALKARESLANDIKTRKNIPEAWKYIFDDEIEKTEEEIRFIEKANQYIQKELEALGIHDYHKLEPGSFCFVDREKLFPEDTKRDVVGLYNPQTNIIFYNKRGCDKFDMYYLLIHEMVHAASFHKFHIALERNAPGVRITQRRLGYEHKAQQGNDQHFAALNEALTDEFASNVIFHNWDDMKKEFSFTESDRERALTYIDYIKVIEKVFQKIAKNSGEEIANVRGRFMRGLFNGNMLHLRDIEETFGKGSLRILATACVPNGSVPESNAIELAQRYFDSEDQKEKDIIAKMILSEYELGKYNKARRDNIIHP